MATVTPKPAGTPSRELIDLAGRTAIVTGGGKGIGLGIARRLHEAGAAIVLADTDSAAAAQAADELGALRPDSALAARTDVSDPSSVETVVGVAVEAFGDIDILVNNAGIFPFAPLGELDLATFRRVIDVNLTGVYLCTKAVSARMIAQGHGGRIINVASIATLHTSMIGLAHTTRPSTVSGASPRTSRSSSPRIASGSTRSRPAPSAPRASATWTATRPSRPSSRCNGSASPTRSAGLRCFSRPTSRAT